MSFIKYEKIIKLTWTQEIWISIDCWFFSSVYWSLLSPISIVEVQRDVFWIIFFFGQLCACFQLSFFPHFTLTFFYFPWFFPSISAFPFFSVRLLFPPSFFSLQKCHAISHTLCSWRLHWISDPLCNPMVLRLQSHNTKPILSSPLFEPHPSILVCYLTIQYPFLFILYETSEILSESFNTCLLLRDITEHSHFLRKE